jgi:hypothetical protein
MDALETVLVFCNDDEHPDIAVTTALKIEHYDNAPVMVTQNMQLYSEGRKHFTTSGDWNLKSLFGTQRLWLERISIWNGSISFSDRVVTMILSNTRVPTNYFYYADGNLVAMTGSSKYFKAALARLLSMEYVEIDDWDKLVTFIKALSGKVNKVDISDLIKESNE